MRIKSKVNAGAFNARGKRLLPRTCSKLITCRILEMVQ